MLTLSALLIICVIFPVTPIIFILLFSFHDFIKKFLNIVISLPVSIKAHVVIFVSTIVTYIYTANGKLIWLFIYLFSHNIV